MSKSPSRNWHSTPLYFSASLPSALSIHLTLPCDVIILLGLGLWVWPFACKKHRPPLDYLRSYNDIIRKGMALRKAVSSTRSHGNPEHLHSQASRKDRDVHTFRFQRDRNTFRNQKVTCDPSKLIVQIPGPFFTQTVCTPRQTALPVPVPLLWGLWAWTLFSLAQPLLYFSTAVCLFQREKICWSQWSPSYPLASLSMPPAVCWTIVLELYINSKQTYTLQSPMAKMLGSHLALARFLMGEDCVCLGIPTKTAGAWQVSNARTPQWTLLSPWLLSKFF